MKKLFSLIILSVTGLFLANSGQAQVSGYLGDISRYGQSTMNGGGTARIRAMGGANTALGGDLSSAFINPAGLGFYNRSEFTISPTFYSRGNDATYFGMEEYQFKNNFNIGHMGFALRGQLANSSGEGWLGGTFALSYQQLNNFTDRFSYQGRNSNSTYADAFPLLDYKDTEENLLNPEDYHTELAVDSYLLDVFPDSDGSQDPKLYFYDSYFPYASERNPVLQSETVKSQGTQGQWNFSYGGNFSDKFYLGAGIGLSRINYQKESVFTERAEDSFYTDNPEDASLYPVNRFEINERISHLGGGINATIGAIARPVEQLTVGLSYRTPTFYTIEEIYDISYTSYFRNNSESVTGNPSETAEINFDTFNYSIRTPGVVNAGIAYFIEKYGLLTADIEYTDFGNSKLTDEFNTLSTDNQLVSNIYSSVVNYRFGGEFRYDKLRFRLGYSHQASPYTDSDSNDYSSNSFSGGLGLRLNKFYTDLAVVRQNRNSVYLPMEREGVQISTRLTTAMLTFGLTF